MQPCVESQHKDSALLKSLKWRISPQAAGENILVGDGVKPSGPTLWCVGGAGGVIVSTLAWHGGESPGKRVVSLPRTQPTVEAPVAWGSQLPISHPTTPRRQGWGGQRREEEVTSPT